MSANIRETRIGIGLVDQADLVTPNVLAEFLTIAKNNPTLSETSLVSESDAQDIGKGHEFATQNFLTNWDTRVQLESFLTSEVAGWAFAMALGTSVSSAPAVGAYRHTATPQSGVVSGIDLPPFSFIEAIRQGGSPVLDRMLIGMVMEGFTIQLNSGPGRQNARITMDLVGTGKFSQPSGITLPAAATLHSLRAGSATIIINGTNYISNKKILSVEVGWRNNVRLDQGFFPGSGTQSGGDIRGRMEYGDREATLRFRARYDETSDEITKQINQTEGTAVITLQGALITGSTYHDLSITFHRVVFRTAPIVDDSGIVAIDVECQPLYHSANGVLTCYATNEIEFLGREA